MSNSIAKFAYQWYIEDSKIFWSRVFGFIRFMDRDFGVVANIFNWTSPLYGDYSYIGKVAGPIFRTMRIIIGSLFYLGIFIAGFFLYVIWLVLPATIAVMIGTNFLALFN